MTPWTIADDGTIEARHAGRIGALSADVSAEHRALIAAAPALLAALQRLTHPAADDDDIDDALAAIAAATGRAPIDPRDPWEHEPLPAEYDDDPIDEPPPLPSESERAARDWAAGRFGG